MKFKKILQKIFKKTFKKIFEIFYGKIILLENENTLKIIKHEINSIKIDEKNFKINKKIYELKNAKIYTDLVEHVSIIKDNYSIPSVSFQQIDGELKDARYNKALSEGTPRFINKFSGTIVSLAQGVSGTNYFHFLFDIISKLEMFSQIIDLKNIDYFYMQGNYEWQKKLLKNFEIPETKLIDCNDFRYIEAERLLVSEHPWYKSGYFQKEIKDLPEWIIFFLRKKFLKLSEKFDCSNRVFIDRSDSNFDHCKLINNNEIKSFLLKRGFQSFEVSKLKFSEQIYLFQNAKTIVSPHGAALSNLVFSSKNLNLIELIPNNHPSRKCERISKILGFNYKRIELEKKNSSFIENGDMEISLEHLEEIINNE